MAEKENIWPKKITVDARIVRILSSSTYTNFPSAIRELITNSYDADAQNVYVDIDLKKEVITVRDDGHGMSENDFAFYLRIAGKNRKKTTLYTEGKRSTIGQFGVGFLSVLPFCDKYLIETKKKGSDEIVYATITSNEYFNDKKKSVNVDQIPIHGGIRKDASAMDLQYTRIRLVGFSKITRSFFNQEYSIKSVRNSIKNFTPFKLLEWELSEYLPIRYNEKGKIGKELNELCDDYSGIPFNVYFNENPLYRNLHASNILDKSDDYIQIGDIMFRYVILSDYNPISPKEARYLMFRNLNVGVGERTTLGLGLDGKVYGKLAHLSGEVFVVQGLNDLISVSRDKFNFSTDYEALKDFLRGKLADIANDLDEIQKINKVVTEFENTTKVSSIKSLKNEAVAKDIESLKNIGFSVKVVKADKKNDPPPKIRLDKNTREVFIPEQLDNFKTITVKGKEHKLKVDRWEYSADSRYTAIKIEKGITIINENHPLFADSKLDFDTFLKFNIILLDLYDKNKLEPTVYKQILKDLIHTFTD